ncbi:ABC-type nickel/cobalt efflux system permease component RcnA [Leifsonia sp. EB41]|uniref:hypothetical protein n=1 Tax=Leifsonia sp. EB41 TaxID=3156260 RepID=UPI003519690D
MVRISKGQLRLALVVSGIAMIACLVAGDYFAAITLVIVAALGTWWQVRHAKLAARDKHGHDRHEL